MLRHGKISYKIEKKEEKSYGKNFLTRLMISTFIMATLPILKYPIRH